MKKENIASLAAGLIIAGAFSYLVFLPWPRQKLAFLWSSSYFYIVYAGLLIAVLFTIASLFLKWLNKKQPNIYSGYLKYPYFIIFLPLALFPVLRCYFKVPYIFCRVCPRKCPWGEVLPVTLPGFLLLNIDKRFWCFKLCPFGSLQDYQAKLCRKRIRLPSWLRYIRYLILLFVVFAAAVVFFNLLPAANLYFFTGSFHYVFGTLAAALAIFVLAFFIPRLWCNYFCPIGSFGDIVLWVESKLKQR